MLVTRLVPLGLLAGTTGCGASYTVVRADDTVHFEAATWHVAPVQRSTEAADVDSEPIATGLMSGLTEAAGDFRFEHDDSGEHPFSLRVVIERTSAEGTRIAMEVSAVIVDARAREVGRLRMDVSTDDDRGALTRAGEDIGRRVMDYIHERYHL